MRPVLAPRIPACSCCSRPRRARPFRPYRLPPDSSSRALHCGAILNDGGPSKSEQEEERGGAMSRRLSEMSERSLEEGGRSARKVVEEAGFDKDLKQQLLERLEGAKFKEDNITAFAQINTPASAGKGTRDLAGARAWTGDESIEDATLRMLDDGHKKIRVPSRATGAQRPPKRIDTGRPKAAPSAGARLANARDRTSMYSYLKDESLSEKEKEQMRKELKDRFSPGARPMPTTLQGLASLANERIEDAIARGQFKNLPRGQVIERDYNMSSPFLDTTEYFLNKMIKKQEIVPPWIEKQQELVATAAKFRSRLRVEWRRHAARVIASQGGPLESQIARASRYAAAEAIVNPPKQKKETLHAVDNQGQMSQITLSGDLKTDGNNAATAENQITSIKITEDPVSQETLSSPSPDEVQEVPAQRESQTVSGDSNDGIINNGAVFPFRDPAWEETERSYHAAAIDNLNKMTRSYNLMAPNLAKKPYFKLEREMRSCFADVAPQLPDAIRERAMAPAKLQLTMKANKPKGVLEHLAGSSARVYDEQKPQYGFREFWRDLFQSKTAN